MPCGGRMGRPADLSRNSCASRTPSWPPFDTASARRDRLTELETKQDELTARLSEAPADIPDIRPNVAETYRRRIERLTVALAHPDDAVEAADAIREVIDRIVLTPGAKRGDLRITLHGDLDTILDWIERTGKSGYKPRPDTASSRLSVSVKTRACPGHPRLCLGKKVVDARHEAGHEGVC